MENKELTQEQKKKLSKLTRSTTFRSLFRGAKCALTIALSALVISSINVFYVKNETFSFVTTVVTFIFIFRSFRVDILAENDRVKKEIKKILES